MRHQNERVRKDLNNSEQFYTTAVSLQRANQPQNCYNEQLADVNEPMRQRIERVREDLDNLNGFYNIDISLRRKARLRKYYDEQLTELRKAPFDSFNQEEKIDYLLLRSYLERNLQQLDLDATKDKKAETLLPFAPTVVRLCEDRQKMKPMDAKKTAQDIFEVEKLISDVKEKVVGKKVKVDRSDAFHAAKTVDRLRCLLAEWFGFFKGYDPMFTWWVAEPYAKVNKQMEELAPAIRVKLVGIKPGHEDAIVGEPIGREGLMADLEAEKIPYTPEELIRIGEIEYVWCEAEMKKASGELGCGEDWRRALEYVKNLYVEPGKQPQLIRDLATEAIDYVKQNDLVTVPSLAAETWRMFMMSPERQKVNPFFLGGDSIQVSYPTDTMGHEAKLMSMRGNNIHFSRSTVFHELIPGHHLQGYMNTRYRPYRRMFHTPFWTEGWSLYWEMILWDKNFPKAPENRIGMLFWRMHRCARIIFSIKFHLGQMTPQQCIDLLGDKVGHERSTAEGEVRRSFAGDYTPLYQAGYMLGALQLYSLRQELVGSGKMTEKQFHDRVLHENGMPIELLRALMEDQPVQSDFKASWKFYKGLNTELY